MLYTKLYKHNVVHYTVYKHSDVHLYTTLYKHIVQLYTTMFTSTVLYICILLFMSTMLYMCTLLFMSTVLYMCTLVCKHNVVHSFTTLYKQCCTPVHYTVYRHSVVLPYATLVKGVSHGLDVISSGILTKITSKDSYHLVKHFYITRVNFEIKLIDILTQNDSKAGRALYIYKGKWGG